MSNLVPPSAPNHPPGFPSNDPMLPVLLRIVELLTILHELLASGSAPASSSTEARKKLARKIQELAYRTNALVTVRVMPGPSRRRSLGQVEVNSRLIDNPNMREFLVMLILASAAQQHDASSSVTASFVRTEDILDHVEHYRVAFGLQDRWEYPVAEDIHRAIKQLRKKLSGISPFLIETGPGRSGYRLSTASINVLVDPPTRTTVRLGSEKHGTTRSAQWRRNRGQL